MNERTPMHEGHTGRPAVGDAETATSGGYNDGISLLSYMIGGILVWSLIGWLLDNVLDTQWIALVGALVGTAGGLYLGHVHNLTRSADPRSSVPSAEAEDELGRS